MTAALRPLNPTRALRGRPPSTRSPGRWMRTAIALFAPPLAASACVAGEPAADSTVIGKCSFDDQRGDIEPGDVYVYALRKERSGLLGVETGVAVQRDSLLDVVVRQPMVDRLPARRVEPNRLEFGGLAADGSGDAEHFIAMGDSPGALFTSIGTTYGTQSAYPACVFWA